jgi:glycosyltransferase involved in cell wall biosynthesis
MMMDDKRQWAEQLSVVIPAYNEEGGIGRTLVGLREALPTCEIIVVDDGSTDGTVEQAKAVPGVRLLKHRINRGYGGALKTGMKAATRPYVAWFDADNEHRVEDLERMAGRIASEGLVAVIGRRPKPGPSVVRNYGKLAIRMLARTLGVDIGKDLNCGLRVFRRSVILRYLSLLPDSFSASMTSTMILIEEGYRFGFEDIEVSERIGTSKVQLEDGFFTLALVLRMVMLFAPLRIFLSFGTFFLVSGTAYGVWRAVLSGRGLPVAGLLLIVTGVLLLMFGLVADQISLLRLSQVSGPSEEDHEEITTGAIGALDEQLAPIPALVGDGTDDDTPT